MRKAIYICFEGTEGVGKTTQARKLYEHLISKGYSALLTKEPGTDHLPLTLTLRALMLDNKYSDQLTVTAREFISQAIRSIHLEKLVIPALTKYDFIIQDRGILSGLAYGTACGNSASALSFLSKYVTQPARPFLIDSLYDSIIYLKGDISTGLSKALQSKQEFETGDAMEAKGCSFLDEVSKNMDEMSDSFNTKTINVNDKSIDEVFKEILKTLNIEE